MQHIVLSSWCRSVVLSIVCFVGFLTSHTRAAEMQNDLFINGFSKIVAPVIQAVVNISTVTHMNKAQQGMDLPQFPSGSPFEELFREFFDGFPFNKPRGPSKSVSLGSGFIIDPAGYIVTNNHVVAEADQITVILHDETKLPAKLVGSDARTDLALLKVETPKPLAFVSWGDGNTVQVGDWVFAIGNPYGLGGTVTKGIISHIGRDISSKIGANYIDGYFQTDAAINVGNSGGPLFNMKGEVIGINTVILSPTGGNVGIGFSIPSFIAQPVIGQLKQFGRTKRGWIGVRFQVMDSEIAESVGLPSAQGALVGSVIVRGPAAKAKMQQGDIILKVNGIPVQDAKKFPRLIGGLPIGKNASFVVWRKNPKSGLYEEITLDIQIEEYEEAEERGALSRDDRSHRSLRIGKPQALLGLRLQALTPPLKKRFKLAESAQGVLVVGVEPDTMAEDKGIQEGDLLIEVGHEEVSTPDEVREKIEKTKRAKRKTVLLLLSRNDQVRFVSIKIHEKLEKSATPRSRGRRRSAS